MTKHHSAGEPGEFRVAPAEYKQDRPEEQEATVVYDGTNIYEYEAAQDRGDPTAVDPAYRDKVLQNAADELDIDLDAAAVPVVDEQPRRDQKRVTSIGANAPCPECGQTTVNIGAAVRGGHWSCRECGCIVMASRDNKIHVVRPGQPLPPPRPIQWEIENDEDSGGGGWRKVWRRYQAKRRERGLPQLSKEDADALLAQVLDEALKDLPSGPTPGEYEEVQRQSVQESLLLSRRAFMMSVMAFATGICAIVLAAADLFGAH